jgi:hypothetical protein
MKMQSCLLSLFMGIVVSSHASDFPVPLEKPSSVKFLSNVPEDFKALDVLLKENKLKEFYKKSRVFYIKNHPKSQDLESIREFFWLAYYVSFAPLFPFEDYDCRTTASFNDNIDLRLLGDVFDWSLTIARNNLDEFTIQQPLKRKELAHLFSLYAARMLHRVRGAYVGDLPEREKAARLDYKKALAECRENATTLEEKLDPFGAVTGKMARNLDNKIVANDGRNMEIKNTVERMEEDFVPTLVRLFPGKKGEVIKYIRMAGYQEGEINDLVDRTVGRDSSTEFLYKGRGKKDAR